ncbi:MAG: hypothetical protein FJ029_13870, partial [Actinobacteria bacterium]|nr:hypothetical protein [Actinomycetota bacterium]
MNVHRDPETGQWRMWYVSSGLFTAGVLRYAPNYLCYATSSDGLAWERPQLGLVEVAGSTANNIVSEDSHLLAHGMLDCHDMRFVEPAEGRFKAAKWFGRGADGLGGHGVMLSADGLRWEPHPGNPVVRAPNSGDSVSLAKLREGFFRHDPPGFPTAKYAMFPKLHVRLGAWRRRCVGVATSDATRDRADGDWSEPSLVLAPDPQDDAVAEERLAAARDVLLYDHPEDHRSEFYALLVQRVGDVLLGYLWVFEPAFECSRLGGGNQHGIVHVQLAASRDLIHWERIGGRRPILDRGAPGSFDAAMIFYHSFPIPAGDEWRVYYAGFDTAHTPGPYLDPEVAERWLAEVRAGRRQLPAIGLATVRREGLVARTAGPAGGTLITRPLLAGGPELAVNAEVAPGGRLTVEVQTLAGA